MSARCVEVSLHLPSCLSATGTAPAVHRRPDSQVKPQWVTVKSQKRITLKGQQATLATLGFLRVDPFNVIALVSQGSCMRAGSCYGTSIGRSSCIWASICCGPTGGQRGGRGLGIYIKARRSNSNPTADGCPYFLEALVADAALLVWSRETLCTWIPQFTMLVPHLGAENKD